jgi:heat shock protein HslJ
MGLEQEGWMKGRSIAIPGAFVTLALLAGACGAIGGRTTLEGSRWILTSLDGLAPVPGSTITSAFDESGQVGGSSGCNSYSAPYLTEGDSLTIGQPVGTLMACDEPLMSQESDYLTALAATASYSISGDALTLRDASGAARLVFGAQSNELAGTSWIVTGYNNGQAAVVSVMAGTEMTAEFGANGILTGNAGCNSYNASFTTSGDSISIGPAASTRMFCEGLMDQESQYLAALNTASTYVVSGNQLELRTAEGALAASFVKPGS